MESERIRFTTMTLNYFAAFILVLILVCCAIEKNKTPLLKNYIRMAMFCVAALLLEGGSYVISFLSFQGANTLRRFVCFLALINGYGLAFFYADYVAVLVELNQRLRRFKNNILGLLFLIATGAMIAGGSVGWYFTVEAEGFTPGRFFLAIFVYDFVACAVGISLIVNYAKRLARKDIVALLSLPLLIFIWGAVQYCGAGMMIGTFLMCSISLFIIYLMIQAERNRQKAEQEKQLVDMNVSMMLTQIQPHFLYNALSSIRRMIRKDPEVAETAVESFSLYLRQNLESMNRTEAIPFDRELAHVEEYLYLETLRFGDRLQVEYDLAFRDFVMPSLSLQPIVENAVKHGVLKREKGGCVIIRTRREEKTVILTVEDDGVGFHPDMVLNDQRMHIGLENVKKRIEMQCEGTVCVESEIGKGTIVTMTIPLI